MILWLIKEKLSLQLAVMAYVVMRRRISHTVYTVGSQMAVLRAGRALLPRNFFCSGTHFS
jgi:hypothetical protein